MYDRCRFPGQIYGVGGGQKRSGTEDDDGKMSAGEAEGGEA